MTRLSFSLFVFTSLMLAARSGAAQTGPTDPYGGMEGRIFDTGTGFKMPYRLGRPPAYDAAVKYPLVIFLCGSGEAGTDNRLNISKNIGTTTPGSIFTTAANQAKFPTFFIAPQPPDKDSAWLAGTPQVLATLKLITALEAEFSIDPKRLYLTGLSIGGRGTWMLITQNPTMFAAAIPMSGEGDPTMAAKIAKIPIWAFHGAKDTAINVAGSRDMIAAITAAGGHPLYTEYPNGQHDIWFGAYTTPNLLPWMNSQRLGMEDVSTDAGVPLPRDGGVDASGGTDAGGAAGASGAAGGGGAGVGGAAGAAGGGGAAGTSGGAGSGGGVAGATGAAGSSGVAGASGVAGSVGSPGAAGNVGSTGAAGGPGVGGDSSGGCACQLGGSERTSVFGVASLAVALAGLARRRRRL